MANVAPCPCFCRHRELRPGEADGGFVAMIYPAENRSPPRFLPTDPREAANAGSGEGEGAILLLGAGRWIPLFHPFIRKASLGATHHAALACFT